MDLLVSMYAVLIIYLSYSYSYSYFSLSTWLFWVKKFWQHWHLGLTTVRFAKYKAPQSAKPAKGKIDKGTKSNSILS